MNLTLSLTYRCNSRCGTCNVWKRKADELTVVEWEQVLRSLGRAPYWVTVSGGEPLLREDAVDIIKLVCRHCRPAILNIPTNGLLPERIERSVQDITTAFPNTNVVVNLSLDGWGADHDRIRGIPGNFERAMDTYRRLKTLRAPGLTLGVHTVVSRLNAESVPDLYVRVRDELAPDSYITEIAEERVELGTIGAEITPDAETYRNTIESLMAVQADDAPGGLGRVTWALRQRYYRMVEQWLHTHVMPIPCYAGWASGQISPDGEVWFCCIKAESAGNLREAGYDFGKVWWGERAEGMRKAIKAAPCACPLANAAYTNMLHHPPTLLDVAWELATKRG
jgi:MoaA/NifB/PqqE/SkfB family radical SAM enzyme